MAIRLYYVYSRMSYGDEMAPPSDPGGTMSRMNSHRVGHVFQRIYLKPPWTGDQGLKSKTGPRLHRIGPGLKVLGPFCRCVFVC